MSHNSSFERTTLVVAIDGVLLNTAAAKSRILSDAAYKVGLTINTENYSDPSFIYGKTWSEAAVLLIDPDNRDETLLDLAVMVAEKKWSRHLSLTPPEIDNSAFKHIQYAHSIGWRVVLRSDYSRRSASSFLDLLEHEIGASRTVATDHPGIGNGMAPTLYRQYEIIASLRKGAARLRSIEPSSEIEVQLAGQFPNISFGWPDQR